MSIAFDHLTLGQRVLFGTTKAVDNAIAAIEDLGARRLVLVNGTLDADVVEAISVRTAVVHRIDEVVQHVPAENVAKATAETVAAEADAIISIGGGSSTGLAKAIALNTGIPVIAIPTTFAGSEATDIWGITEGRRKTTGADSRVLPKVVIYDASLTSGLPTALAVASGLNAVAHAVDGFWAPRADPINRALGTEGLRMLFPGLRGLGSDPREIEAREQLLYGAYLAAVAFASAGSGMHHKICHALGGAFNLPHAEMHSILLPYVTEFNAPFAPDAADRINSTLGSANAAAGLNLLRTELGSTSSLAEIGLEETDIDKAAELALPLIPASNPRPVTLPELTAIIRAAWAAEPIS